MTQPVKPFESVDSSLEYVGLLADAIDEAVADIEEDISQAITEGAARRLEALRLVAYTLARLHDHVTTSRRLLKNLRSLRSLLLGEKVFSSHSSISDQPATDEIEAFEQLLASPIDAPQPSPHRRV